MNKALMLLYNSIVQYFIGYQLCRINFIYFLL